MKRTIIGLGILAAALWSGPAAADLPAGKTILIDHHTVTLEAIDPALCGRAGCDFAYAIRPHLTPVCGHAGPMCDCFAQPEYDTSGWSAGPTPFFDLAGHPSGYCAVHDPDGSTLWQIQNDLFVRAEFELCPGAKGLEVHVAIDNSAAVWFNGTRLADPPNCMATSHSPEGLCDTEFCAVYDRLKFFVDDDLLRFAPEKNVLAFQLCDHGAVSFFDFDVVADLSAEVPCGLCEETSVVVPDLWPPNHKWSPIQIVDASGKVLEATIDSVFQDEPTEAIGSGDGNTCPDADGVGTTEAWVRVERAGDADGRVYHVAYTLTDEEGDTCQATGTVCVPHDQGNGEVCVDQGALYDSTVCE
jgi:hypothetical protein